MNTIFKVITDIDSIFELNQIMNEKIRNILPLEHKKEITSPSGRGSFDVFFEKMQKKTVRAWAPFTRDMTLGNVFMTGDPLSNDPMQIDVQINFPAEKYHRRLGGAFVVDHRGNVFIAHTGKLTKGNAGLKKAKVLDAFSTQAIEARDNEKISRLILISSLEDTEIADNIWSFARKSREVAAMIASS